MVLCLQIKCKIWSNANFVTILYVNNKGAKICSFMLFIVLCVAPTLLHRLRCCAL